MHEQVRNPQANAQHNAMKLAQGEKGLRRDIRQFLAPLDVPNWLEKNSLLIAYQRLAFGFTVWPVQQQMLSSHRVY